MTVQPDLRSLSPGPGPTPVTAPEARDRLRAAAIELEASFLAEMLKQARFGAARDSFGGGPGEEQFASMLRLEHARAMAGAGGVGLAEHLFRAMLARAPGGPDG